MFIVEPVSVEYVMFLPVIPGTVNVDPDNVEVNIVFAVIVEPVAVKKTRKLLLSDPVCVSNTLSVEPFAVENNKFFTLI